MPTPDPADDQTQKAAAEAGGIGGRPSSDPQPEHLDEAQRPLAEAGEGEAEGFEEAERELIERASHGDQHAARRVLENVPATDEDPHAARGAEADHERSSERDDG